jgi:membrane protein implicated in regulation of membrane protease activity
MAAVYLFTLILGGGLLVLSLLGGESSDVDLGELELDGLGDVGDAADLGGAEGPDADGTASKIFSLRSLIYALFGFGGTGSLLTALGITGTATLLAAAVTGLVLGALVSIVFGYLHRTESGAMPGDEALLGLTGHVVLPMSAESPGAVVVLRGDRQLRLRALPHASGRGDPSEWERILVVEVEGGVARVTPLEDDRLLDS